MPGERKRWAFGGKHRRIMSGIVGSRNPNRHWRCSPRTIPRRTLLMKDGGCGRGGPSGPGSEAVDGGAEAAERTPEHGEAVWIAGAVA